MSQVCEYECFPVSCLQDSMVVQQRIAMLRREAEQETQILQQVKDSCHEASENLKTVEEEGQWMAVQLQVTVGTREQIQSQVQLCSLSEWR